MTNNKDGNLTRYKIKELQADMTAMQADIRKIMENHLPHIQQELIGVKTRVNVMAAINIGGIILVIISRFLLN